MSIKKHFISEIKHETERTMQILNALKDENLSWQPHEKSMTTGKLANHIVQLHNWVGGALAGDELDFLNYKTPSHPDSIEGLKADLDEGLTKSIAVVESFSDDEWDKPWTLRAGDRVIFTMPKSAVLRYMVHNHLIHHRGQITVYLRMQNLPVPGLYGPSADER